MLPTAQEAALQASQLAVGASPLPPAPGTPMTAPTPGEVFPSTTVSMPIAASTSSSRKEEVEGAEAKKARLEADAAAQASVGASQAAALGTTDMAAASAPKTAEVPTVAPSGQGLAGGIPQAPTLVEQKQTNALAIAAAEKEFQDRKIAAEAAQRAITERRRAELQAQTEQARQDYTAAKNAPTFEKNGWGWDLMRALAVGAGAYGAAINHTQNFAQDILDKAVDRALSDKRQKMEVALRKMESMGVSEERIDKLHDRELTQTIGSLQGQLDQVKNAANVLLARFPTEQLKANEMIADKQAKLSAEVAKRAENVGKVTKESGRNTPASMMQVVQPGTKQNGQQQAQRETVNELVASKSQAQLLNEFEGIVKRNPKAWAAYRDANKELAEFEIAKEGPVGGLLKTGQAVGYSGTPLSLDQRLDQLKDRKVAEDAKRINQIWPIIQTGEARILDPVGVLNEASQEQARKHLNMYTMTPDEAIKLSKQFRSQHEERAQILEAGTTAGKVGARVQAPQPARSPQSGPPSSGLDLAKRLSSLPAADQPKAAEAMLMSESDPRYKDADAWLRRRGLR